MTPDEKYDMEAAYERWLRQRKRVFTAPEKIRLTFEAFEFAWKAAVARERVLEAKEARRQLDEG